jgi:hypothetical protein
VGYPTAAGIKRIGLVHTSLGSLKAIEHVLSLHPHVLGGGGEEEEDEDYSFSMILVIHTYQVGR